MTQGINNDTSMIKPKNSEQISQNQQHGKN